MKSPSPCDRRQPVAGIAERTAEILGAVRSLGLRRPKVFPNVDGGQNLSWQKPGRPRTTVYIDPGEPFEVERTPDGPSVAFHTYDARAAAHEVSRLLAL